MSSEGTRQYPTKEHWSRTPEQLHWATVFVARDHRADDIEKLGEWLCECRSCANVRRSLHSLHSGSPGEPARGDRRHASGGVR